MLQTIVAKQTGYLTLEPGCRVALLVNNLGGSTLLEAYAVLNTALHHLTNTMQVGITNLETAHDMGPSCVQHHLAALQL